MDVKLAKDLVIWLTAHPVCKDVVLGVCPSGGHHYRCSCGAVAPNEEPLDHTDGCVWKKTDGDPNVAEFTRTRLTAAVMCSIGTMKASILGARIADFDRETHGTDKYRTNGEIQLLILDFLEIHALPRDVLTEIVLGYMQQRSKDH